MFGLSLLGTEMCRVRRNEGRHRLSFPPKQRAAMYGKISIQSQYLTSICIPAHLSTIFSPRRFTASSFVTNKAALQRSAVATNALYQQQKTAASSSSLNMVLKDPTDTDVAIGGGGGMFTASNSENRRVVPENAGDRPVMKVVYVVLESQYQSSMTGAVKRINAGSENMAVECVGYLLEELRDDATFEQFKKDVEEANIFIGSLIFVQELAEKVTEVVKPLRDQLDAVLVFPSMPEVMRLNKVGSFTMKNLGQSKSVVADFMKKKKQDDGSSFEEGMLKLLRTLPKVLKFLPSDKAADARTFMMSFQYWLGGECNHIYMYLLVLICALIFMWLQTLLGNDINTILFTS